MIAWYLLPGIPSVFTGVEKVFFGATVRIVKLICFSDLQYITGAQEFITSSADGPYNLCQAFRCNIRNAANFYWQEQNHIWGLMVLQLPKPVFTLRLAFQASLQLSSIAQPTVIQDDNKLCFMGLSFPSA